VLLTRIISLVWGLMAISATAVTFTPHLAWVNYLIIPFAGLGLIPGILALRRYPDNKSMAVTGIVLCGTAILYGITRFAVGFGVV
jgi:hypothetical protein